MEHTYTLAEVGARAYQDIVEITRDAYAGAHSLVIPLEVRAHAMGQGRETQPDGTERLATVIVVRLVAQFGSEAQRDEFRSMWQSNHPQLAGL